jgi:hypothetical protein
MDVKLVSLRRESRVSPTLTNYPDMSLEIERKFLTNGASRKHFAMHSPPFAGIAQRHEPTPR